VHAAAQAIIGKKLFNKQGYSIANADGTVTGQFGGEVWSGTWETKGDFWCREGSVGTETIPYDCQVLTLAGDQLTLIRNQGSGDTILYSVEN